MKVEIQVSKVDVMMKFSGNLVPNFKIQLYRNQ
jgi:hypothetical protein